jgi:hypothetical protein
MTKMFDFTAADYTDAFARDGLAHIPQGLSAEFHSRLLNSVENSSNKDYMEEFARGDKQQTIFSFLEPEHYDELRQVVATVCGVEATSLTLSERHIKFYEADANPYPLAHKDRFGSEVAIGFSIRVPEGSTLVVYPDHDVSVNPFNSTAELRSSFSRDALPEPGLKTARRVEIKDRPRDVMLFRGSAMWHLREHGAGTTVLYLKMNTYNCDTLGEDPHTVDVREHTLSVLNSSSSEWAVSIPMIARRVDYIHRRYDRDWNELFGVVLYNQPHATITETEFKVLQLMDGEHTITEIAAQVEQTGTAEDGADAIRRLAQRGIVDFLAHPVAVGQIGRRKLTQAA